LPAENAGHRHEIPVIAPSAILALPRFGREFRRAHEAGLRLATGSSHHAIADLATSEHRSDHFEIGVTVA
jgi:hypothetical protein